MTPFNNKTRKTLADHDQRLKKLEKDGAGGKINVTDKVEENNPNPVQSGAVYNHVAEQVGNIEILLGTI